ncbi:hypothetical protein COB55_01750 [Candidatus Wolfebacteria bacterium]|nr:MAG: hypothetical protein COB55_01750 [Candidatus Wolfebacteria bacterium]
MKYLLTTLLIFPTVLYAEEPSGDVLELVLQLQDLVTALIPVAFAAAFLFFFWGLAKFILGAGDEEKKASGKAIMMGGIFSLFLMASILGIIDFIGGALGIEQGGTLITPHVETN